MVTILPELGRTFGEYSLLTGYTDENCKIPNISLETKLSDTLCLKIPLLSAAMTSVTGLEMALALGKEGGLGILPLKLPIEEQAEFVKRIKNYEMGFVEVPVSVYETATIEEVLREIEKHGHSRIPVVNRNNVFKGMFDKEYYWTQKDAPMNGKVTSAMVPFDNSHRIPYCNKPGIDVNEAKRLLEANGEKYLVVLDEQDRLVKLAFKKDVEKVKVGAAISTHEDWLERSQANIEAGVDLIVIDTSDGYSAFTENVIRLYKKEKFDVPLCAGNIITYEGAKFLMEAGADILKVGMSSGSICITQQEKAVGRGPMTALIEVDRARNDYRQKTNKYIPLIIDGGIARSAQMIVALTMADAIMMGGYFNRFYEAAGDKLDKSGKPTTIDDEIVEVSTWGEGSLRAKNLDRYGHSKRTFFAEGVEAKVPYLGRLKPNLKMDLLKISAALSNAGCRNLNEFRERAVLELNSQPTSMIVSNVHDVKTDS